MSSSIRQNGTENHHVPRKRTKVFNNKPHSSSSVSSSDEDVVLSNQRGFTRPGITQGRSFPVHGSSRTPGFSFGSAKKVIVKKSITKFHPENKRKRKLLKPVNTASILGVKPWIATLQGENCRERAVEEIRSYLFLSKPTILSGRLRNLGLEKLHMALQRAAQHLWLVFSGAQARTKKREMWVHLDYTNLTG